MLNSTLSKLALGTALGLTLCGTAAVAQTTITGIRDVSDRVEDIERDVRRDMNRAEDIYRFGSPGYRTGIAGSASLGYSGKTGNNKSQDFTLGLRMTHSSGQLVQTIGAVVDFQEANSVKTKEDYYVVYDASYYFDDRFYMFGLARVNTNGLATAPTDIRRDAFVGVGPGYRFVNTPNTAWRGQIGVGVSYLQNGAKNSVTETGYLASSRVYHRFTDTVFMTNDTDVLKSDAALRVSNDLGVNFKVSDSFSTRVSYLTDYNDSRAKRTDNKLGVSIVFGF